MILEGSTVLGLFVEGRRDSALGWMEMFSLERVVFVSLIHFKMCTGKKSDDLDLKMSLSEARNGVTCVRKTTCVCA